MSDVAYLEDEWDATIDEHSLRRGSTVLRNLLVENALGRAWRIAGLRGEPQVEAVDLMTVVQGLRFDKIPFAAAGGGTSGAAYVAGALVYRGAMSESTIKTRSEAMRGGPPRRCFRLSEFLASPSIIVAGQTVNRRLVIKFVANKKGGAHLRLHSKEGRGRVSATR